MSRCEEAARLEEELSRIERKTKLMATMIEELLRFNAGAVAAIAFRAELRAMDK